MRRSQQWPDRNYVQIARSTNTPLRIPSQDRQAPSFVIIPWPTSGPLQDQRHRQQIVASVRPTSGPRQFHVRHTSGSLQISFCNLWKASFTHRGPPQPRLHSKKSWPTSGPNPKIPNCWNRRLPAAAVTAGHPDLFTCFCKRRIVLVFCCLPGPVLMSSVARGEVVGTGPRFTTLIQNTVNKLWLTPVQIQH